MGIPSKKISKDLPGSLADAHGLGFVFRRRISICGFQGVFDKCFVAAKLVS